jgi:PAS domain S-box-containing protein
MNTDDSTTALQAEVAALRQQLAESTAQLTALRESHAILEALVENNPGGISVISRDSRVLLVNRIVEDFFQRDRTQLVGKTTTELVGPEVSAAWDKSDRPVLIDGKTLLAEDTAPHPDGDRTFLTMKFPLRNPQGEIYAIGNILTDITTIKQAEYERQHLQQTIIDAQRAILRELSTPLMPIAPGVVVMPLIGSIDDARAEQIVSTLLEGISTLQADTAILDITGVKVVDTFVAQTLLRAAQAAQLLGATVILTGISREAAMTFVHLDFDARGIIIHSSLANGIKATLQTHGR